MGKESRGGRPTGYERRAAVMQPGEEFLGNWDNGGDPDAIMPGNRNVYQQIEVYKKIGQYSGFRVIPAFNESGQSLPSMKGIVAVRLPETVLAVLVPRPRQGK